MLLYFMYTLIHIATRFAYANTYIYIQNLYSRFANTPACDLNHVFPSRNLQVSNHTRPFSTAGATYAYFSGVQLYTEEKE